MKASRSLTTAFFTLALSALSCGVVPIAPVAETSTDETRSTVQSAAETQARAAARVLGQLHTGLLADEIAELSVAIVREAERTDVPVELVLALIQVESSGNTFAVSHVGALGLMQLLPSTAEEVAGRIGMLWTGDAQLFEPVTNVRLGVEYLRQLIDRYESIPIALAAYNWGPGRIGQKLRRGETIPAGYADKVLAKYRTPTRSSI